jgi:tripeptide aminopeptidase
MLKEYAHTIEQRFLRYVQLDTQSDPAADSFPSTQGQRQLAALLAQELRDMGISDVELDEWGYVYATIEATVNKPLPVICFCAHVDTAPDCSGAGVRPMVHRNYQGQDIILPDDPSQIISEREHPYLKEKHGHDIVTASGTTLLGADDKAGVAIIMDLAHYLVTHPEFPHGKVRILFTPDEEIGKGTQHVDLKKLGADFGYTLDGGDLGSLEDESFCADEINVVISGVIVHPGYAKNKMVNALKIAATLLQSLPTATLSPETTSGREGFIHPISVNGLAESCSLHFLLRDFTVDGLHEKEALLRNLTQLAIDRYPGARYEWIKKEQYRNMKEVLDRHPQVVALAKEAMEGLGLMVKQESIRGGTDGSRLSVMGLPCANIFAGQQLIHSRREFVSVQDMQMAVAVLVKLLGICEQRTKL